MTIVREMTLPSLQERLATEAGLPVERAGYGVMRTIEEAGSLPISALARSVGLDTSTVSPHVATLTGPGLLAHSPGPHDRRVMRVSLTEAGRAALGTLREVRHRMFFGILPTRSARDRETLAPLLTRLARDLTSFGARS